MVILHNMAKLFLRGTCRLFALLSFFRGPKGTVHRVLERSTGRSFVAKTVEATATERGSVLQEAAILSDLQHPKVLGLHEVLETPDGHIIFILELWVIHPVLSNFLTIYLQNDHILQIVWGRHLGANLVQPRTLHRATMYQYYAADLPSCGPHA